MAVTITVTPRVQAAAKKLPVAESRILGEFMRLVLVNGVNPSSAASTAHAHIKPLDPKDKAVEDVRRIRDQIRERVRAFIEAKAWA